jgi:peptide/nickel transport system substrate-binding protein
VEFLLLGSVGLWIDGREVVLGGPKQRAVLALLLLNAGRVVSRDRLIDGLWGEQPPESAAHTLDGYISRLRKLVGTERLLRERHGYRLVVEPGELDLERFERDVQGGRAALAAGDDRGAVEQLTRALGEWHDVPLADLQSEPFAAAATRDLEERRLAALEQRMDAELSLGRSDDLVAELERLVAANPFRERLIGQLALALHRSGRSADALAQLAEARQRFGSELGLELSPALRQLERGILQHEPGLLGRRPRAQTLRRRRVAIVSVAVLAAVAAGTAAWLAVGGGGTRASKSPTGLIASVGGNARVAVADSPGALASGNDALWLAEPSQSLVLRVDPRSSSIVDRISVTGTPGALAAGAHSLWVATSQPASVQRIDFATDKVTQTIPVGVNLVALAVGGGGLWAADYSDESLIELNPLTGSPARTVSLTSHPSSLVIDGTTCWVASHDDGVLTEVDLRTGAPVATANVGAGPSGLALAHRAVWVANDLAGTITRVDPATMASVATLATGSGASAITSTNGTLWVANQFSRTVSRIDARTNRIVRTSSTAGAPVALASVGGRVWTAMASAAPQRGGRLVLLSQGPFTSMDPAIEYEIFPPQLHGLAYDALVTFDHTGGAKGLQIVPDLALAVPVPSDGGLTYALRLRPGIRYSDGRFVRAQDVRRAFERLFRVRSPVAPAFQAIVGSARCGVAFCDLSHGITTDDARGSIVFHLTRVDTEFLYKLAFVFTAPVPPGAPWTEMKTTPFPGTGPYRIAKATRRTVVLVRNRFFHEWSHAAQPNGNPDEIVWRFGLSPAQEVRAIEAGRADWMFDNVPAEVLSSLRRERRSQLHPNVAPETDFVAIDTHNRPFDDVRVRRALNLAIDRKRVVAYYGNAARATCQILPPGVPGFVPYCPYRYDLAAARRLVAAAGARGARVSLVGFKDDATIQRPLILYLASVLRGVGLDPQIVWTTHATFTGAGRPDLVPNAWYADYPAASDFFSLFLECDGVYNRGRFCDPVLDRQIRAASNIEAADPQRAAVLWAGVDRRAVDHAAWAPLANPTLFDFTSARVRGYQHNLLWGFLADQVELRRS